MSVSVLIVLHHARVAGHTNKLLHVILLLDLRIQLVHYLVKVSLHLGVLSQEVLRVHGLGHVLVGPLLRLVRQLLELMLLQAGLQIELIGHLFFHIFVLLKQTFGVFAALELLYLNDCYLVEKAQDPEYVFSAVVHIHLLESVEGWVHY